MQQEEPCGICGGDGRIGNSFGSTATCPSCHGTGRRAEQGGFRDVTKTKQSHHQPTNRAEVIAKTTWPTTHAGAQLAEEVKSSGIAADAKARLTREIIEYEDSHGQCTQTFIKKIRKQFRPKA